MVPEWLRDSMAGGLTPPIGVLAWRIGAAFLLGLAVAGFYRHARRGEAVPPTFLTTLVLLATLIAMATQVIGDNVARAFSLVGALSVVRFRTVVRDTQDTAFVIFAVVMGMAAGSNHLAVALVGLAILGLASFVLWPRRDAALTPRHRPEEELVIRLAPNEAARAGLETLLGEVTSRRIAVGARTARRGEAMELTYRVRLKPGSSPAEIVNRLTALDGVEAVDLHRAE